MAFSGSVLINNADVTDGVINYYIGHLVSFEHVTVPVDFSWDRDNHPYFAFATPGTPDVEYHWDKFIADILVLTDGSDSFQAVEGYGVQQVYGRGGDDYIGESFYGGGMYMDGGGGNDVLYGGSGLRETLIGGNGNDVLKIYGPDKATGGAGSDTFVLEFLSAHFLSANTSAFICDFQATGPDHDVIELSFQGHNYANFTEAAADGTVGIRYHKGYTYLDVDTNADHIPDLEVAHIKGIIAPELVDQVIVPTSTLFGASRGSVLAAMAISPG